jgi:hypothetical protein
MRGRRTQKTGGVFAGIRCGFFGTEKNVDARPSFAAVEVVMSDRLLWIFTIKFIYDLPCNIESFIAIQGGTAFPLIHDDL